MKKIEIVSSCDVRVNPFIPQDFTQNEAWDATIENTEKKRGKKIRKKELKDLAESLSLDYDDADIAFAKKLLNAYLTGKK